MELSDVQKEHFWEKVNKTDTCWLWTACLDRNGYGKVSINDKPYLVHRVSYILSGNIIPIGLGLLHSCRSKNCVNPSHLTPGTQKQNCADMVRDGTAPIGEKSSSAKLTEEQVREIRTRSTENRRILGEEFGVTGETISDIIHRKSWKHIT